MTHRPIAAIDINGFTPGGTPRALPIFEWVDPGTLLVDAGYQRDLGRRSLALIRRIVAGWDWARFKAPIAVMTDAGLELIDGQCTSIAAATHPAVDMIPVMIVEAVQRRDRATAFIGHNRDRVAVTPAQIHVAALVGGDAEALAVDRVCQLAGVTILSVPSKTTYKPGETLAVTAIASLVRGRGEDGAALVLKCMVAAGCAPMTQLHIKAGDLLLHTDEYSREIDAERLAAVIATMGQKVDAEAKVFVAAHPSTPLWKAIAICWFKARRGATKSTTNIAGNITALSGQTKTPSKPAGSQNCAKSQLGRPPVAPLLGRQHSPHSAPATDEEDRPRALMPPERKGESIAAGAKKDVREELGRWQPGNHLRRCGPCGSPFVGGRKAEHCADCAYRAEEVANA